MSIGPVDPQGVIADELHVVDGDRGGDARQIERSDAGVLVDTAGTLTLPAQCDEAVARDVVVRPGKLEHAFLTQCLHVAGHFRHRLLS